MQPQTSLSSSISPSNFDSTFARHLRLPHTHTHTHTHTKKEKKEKKKKKKKDWMKLCSRSYTTFFGKMKLTIKWKAYGLLVCTKPLIDSLSWAQLFTRKVGYVYQLDASTMLAQRYKCLFFFSLFFFPVTFQNWKLNA